MTAEPEIRPAWDELAALVAAMRGWPYEQVREGITVLEIARWTWKRAYNAALQAAWDPYAKPGDLERMIQPVQKAVTPPIPEFRAGSDGLHARAQRRDDAA
jgi:hypothetical protein